MNEAGSQPHVDHPHHQENFVPGQNDFNTMLYTALGTPVQIAHSSTDDVSFMMSHI